MRHTCKGFIPSGSSWINPTHPLNHTLWTTVPESQPLNRGPWTTPPNQKSIGLLSFHFPINIGLIINFAAVTGKRQPFTHLLLVTISKHRIYTWNLFWNWSTICEHVRICLAVLCKVTTNHFLVFILAKTGEVGLCFIDDGSSGSKVEKCIFKSL